MFSAICVMAVGLDLGGTGRKDQYDSLGPETPPLPPADGGMREDKTTGMAAKKATTAAATTAAATTAAATTAAATTAAATTASPTTGAECVDDNAGLAKVTEGELDSCAVGASATFGLCADEDFAALCCDSCKTVEKEGPAAASCKDDDELLAQASGGQIAACEEALEYCYDVDVQALCCASCSGGGTTALPATTTVAPAAPKPLMDPALAAVQAATAVADEKKNEARIAVAAADAAAEAAEAAQAAAEEAMNAQVQSNTKPTNSTEREVSVPDEDVSVDPYSLAAAARLEKMFKKLQQ